MKVSATLKSGTTGFSAGAAEVAWLVLFSELQENDPTIDKATMNDLIFENCLFELRTALRLADNTTNII